MKSRRVRNANIFFILAVILGIIIGLEVWDNLAMGIAIGAALGLVTTFFGNNRGR